MREQRAGADEGAGGEVDAAGERGVETDEGFGADAAMRAGRDARGEKAMVFDLGVVGDDGAAPDDYVTADLHIGLYDTAFLDEGIGARGKLTEVSRAFANVADQFVTKGAGLLEFGGADFVHGPVADGDEHREIIRGIAAGTDILEIDDGKIEEGIGLTVTVVDGKSGYLMGTMARR